MQFFWKIFGNFPTWTAPQFPLEAPRERVGCHSLGVVSKLWSCSFHIDDDDDDGEDGDDDDDDDDDDVLLSIRPILTIAIWDVGLRKKESHLFGPGEWRDLVVGQDYYHYY